MHKKNRISDCTTSKFISGLLEDYLRGILLPADELPPSPEKLLSDIGILQNDAQVLKDQLQAQKEVINQKKTPYNPAKKAMIHTFIKI